MHVILSTYMYPFLKCVWYNYELVHHVTQGEEKKWELCTVLFLVYYPSSAEHSLDFSSCATKYIALACSIERENDRAEGRYGYVKCPLMFHDSLSLLSHR